MEQLVMRKKMFRCPAMCCIPQEVVIGNVKLATAYVPYETLCSLFPPVEALKRGTAFPELYSPYMGKKMRSAQMKTSNFEEIPYEKQY